MKRIVIRPRIQVPLLVVLSSAWSLLGLTYFTAGDVVAKRDWAGIGLGSLLLVTGVLGIWRALRLGVVIGDEGIRIRGFDSRQRVIPWSGVQAIDCAPVDFRAGVPIYGPVISLKNGQSIAVRAVGSYSRAGAEARVEQLRGLAAGQAGEPGAGSAVVAEPVED